MSTIKDVAREAGVSIATVSFVINGTKHVSPQTEARVHKAIAELNYRVNHFASNIKSGKSGSVAFIMADMSNPFFLETAVTIEKVLREAKYNLILANTDEKLNIEKDQINNLLNHSIDGLIIAPTTLSNAYLKTLLPKGFPLVFFDRVPTDVPSDCVVSDNLAGSREAVEYLISLGHKRIGIISGMTGITSSFEREAGYIEALNGNGLDIDRSLMINGDGKRSSGYLAMQRLMSSTDDLSAVFITNNLMALGAFQFLTDNGIKVPEDISVVVFDDYEWSAMTNPSITSVKQNTVLLGQKVAELILDKMSNRGNEVRKSVEYRIPTELIKRSSCLSIKK